MPVHTPPTATVLEVLNLEGQRGERTLFQGLNLQLAGGDVVWLRGRNGRGKTTLLRILAGLTTPAAGEIRLFGQAAAGSQWRAQLSYVAHTNALKEDLNATEALAFLTSLGAQTATPVQLKAALTRLGVSDRARAAVRTLSQGQRRRVALARLALVTTPQLWLLDEPFDALDDQGITTLNALLTEHSQRGGAVLLTSHQALSLREPAVREFSLDPFAVGR